MKKILKTILLVALICFCVYMIYAHRRVIRAWIKGEEMPKAPKGHCHCNCSCQ